MEPLGQIPSPKKRYQLNGVCQELTGTRPTASADERRSRSSGISSCWKFRPLRKEGPIRHPCHTQSPNNSLQSFQSLRTYVLWITMIFGTYSSLIVRYPDSWGQGCCERGFMPQPLCGLEVGCTCGKWTLMLSTERAPNRFWVYGLSVEPRWHEFVCFAQGHKGLIHGSKGTHRWSLKP